MTNDQENTKQQPDPYLESAKINQENLWKRRQIEWRTSFALWIAIGVSTGYIYLYAHRPIPIPWYVVSLIVFIIYFCVVVFQHIHLRAHFISNEKDIDFINYNLNKSAWIFDKKDFNKPPERPYWAVIDEYSPKRPDKPARKNKDAMKKFKNDNKEYRKDVKHYEHYYYKINGEKMKYHWTPIGITILIAVLSLFILTLMCFEPDKKSDNPSFKVENNSHIN